MKIARLLTLALLIMTGMIVAAQDLTETTTVGAITVSHPAGYVVEEIAPGAVGLLDESETRAVFVIGGSAIAAFGLPEDVSPTAQALIDVLPTVTGDVGDAEPVSLAIGDGLVVEAIIPGVGTSGLIYAFDTDSGLVIAFIMTESGEMPDDFRALGEAIIGSAVITADAAAPTDEPTIDPADPTATPDNGDESTPETGPDGETCPIPVDDMPEQTIVFCPGVQITLPENWALTEGTTEIDTFGFFSREEFSASVSTSVAEISQYYNPEDYIADNLVFVADSVGHEAFDPAEHLVTVLEEDGRTVQLYNPADYIEISDEDFWQIVAIVTLNNDLWVTHSFSLFPPFDADPEQFVTDVQAEIEQIVMSTVLTDFYDGVPAIVEIDGETVFVHEALWTDATYGFTYEDAQTFVVICPPGGDANSTNVWGTDIYTHDSSVCAAAVHAGVVTQSDGGTVKVTMLPGQESYEGSTRNGVESMDYGSWNSSYSVETFELPE